jgi:hypothetical protein
MDQCIVAVIASFLSISAKGVSLDLTPQTPQSKSISVVKHPSFDLGTLEGKVLGPTGLPAIGASVMAEKELGVISSIVKEGGYTTNSFVTVDGSYSFNIPSGVYRITVVFPDGTNLDSKTMAKLFVFI